MNNSFIYLDEKGKDRLYGFNVMEVHVNRPSRVIGAPVEDGSVSFDNKVLDPAIITVRGVVNGRDSESSDVLSRIEKMYQNRDFEFYSISDGMDFYSPLILQDAPYRRTTRNFDLASFDLVFKEAMLIQGSGESPLNPEHTSTKNTGYTSGSLS